MTDRLQPIPIITLVGGGYTGTIATISLLRSLKTPHKIRVIEYRRMLGEGIAYSTPYIEHLLNVPAQKMSAFHDVPNDFVDWLLVNHLAPADQPGECYVPRRWYCDYLRDCWSNATRTLPSHLELEIIEDEAHSCKCHDSGWLIATKNHGSFFSDQVILSFGNLPPALLPFSHAVIQNPWDWQAFKAIATDARIAIIGSGLTMVDVVLRLQAQGHKGAINVISRHGYLPLSHVEKMLPTIEPVLTPDSPLKIFKQFRAALSQDFNWRQCVDSLRPITREIWSRWTAKQRQQFARHLRSLWDVHRHRIAPEVSDLLQALLQSDRLTVHAGRIRDMSECASGVAISWLPRHGSIDALSQLESDVVINCTGPSATRFEHPLLHQLIADQLVRWDGLGIDCDTHSRVTAPSGESYSNLFALGPLTKGRWFEMIAVPDIRQQIAEFVTHVKALDFCSLHEIL